METSAVAALSLSAEARRTGGPVVSNVCSPMLAGMGTLEDPADPHSVERLRRSIVMLQPGQAARIDRDRALGLLASLQRLQVEHQQVITELRSLLGRLEAG